MNPDTSGLFVGQILRLRLRMTKDEGSLSFGILGTGETASEYAASLADCLPVRRWRTVVHYRNLVWITRGIP